MAENRHWGGVTARESRTFGSQGGPVRGEEGWRGQGRAAWRGRRKRVCGPLRAERPGPTTARARGRLARSPAPPRPQA